MKILAVNAGSSSLKFQLFQMPKEEVLLKGEIERIGLKGSNLMIKYNDKKETINEYFKDHMSACKKALNILLEKNIIKDLSEIKGVVHRVVQGGEVFTKPTIITEEVIKKIEDLIPLAPLHNGPNLVGIKAFYKALSNTPNVACFDTEFHKTLKPEAYNYSIPYEYYEKYKIRKYGFHGMSHQYVSEEARKILGMKNSRRLIIAHLGGGCSLTAILDGKSIDTSMGFTPLSGISMCTRSGSIDPAIINFLVKNEKLTIDEVEEILNKKSGLLGVSGVSSDSRDVIISAETTGNKRAALATSSHIKQIIDYIGSYYFQLKGLDALVFTAGIGENAFEYRERIAKELSFLGVKLDKKINGRRKPLKPIITTPDSKIKILVIPTNEELAMVRAAYRLIRG